MLCPAYEQCLYLRKKNITAVVVVTCVCREVRGIEWGDNVGVADAWMMARGENQQARVVGAGSNNLGA
jgi:hypothetical protein